MSQSNNREHLITVFEHETIRFDKGEKRISEDQFKALQHHYGDGIPYYTLTYNGVKFNEHVGVIQIGKTVIEVLPKADKNNHMNGEENKWRDILIGMLKSVGGFDIQSTSNSNLKIKPNSILDLYFEMFVAEVEYLIHIGLIKKYRKTEGNSYSLKGSIQFSQNIQQNLTHQERFFVKYTKYDNVHLLHSILYKTICLLKRINTNTQLHSRIGNLLINFPELPDIKVTDATFEKITLNRKSQSYKKAIQISRLLLLHYHPDISKGRNDVLAIMFDMNKLWEQFVYVSLNRFKGSDMTVTAQTSKNFWKPDNGYHSKIRPDIVLNKGEKNCVVLDTKWKNLNGGNPSPDDLRQMFVYHEYYNANKVALIYPSSEISEIGGVYANSKSSDETVKNCSVIGLKVLPNIKEWQMEIRNHIQFWVEK